MSLEEELKSQLLHSGITLDALNPDELCDFCWQTGEYHEDCNCNTCKYRHDCGGIEQRTVPQSIQ